MDTTRMLGQGTLLNASQALGQKSLFQHRTGNQSNTGAIQVADERAKAGGPEMVPPNIQFCSLGKSEHPMWKCQEIQ